MKYLVRIGPREISVEILESGGALQVGVNGRIFKASAIFDQNLSRLSLLLNDQSYDAEIYRTDGVTSVFLLGGEFDCTVEDERLLSLEKAAGLKHHAHGAELRAPMPGLVLKILKSIGDTVQKGESLLVVEAMKMENELRAPVTGTIREIHVRPGKPVDKGQVLIAFDQ